jgi:pectin methylesterase-like acyl-CoA thioesterase
LILTGLITVSTQTALFLQEIYNMTVAPDGSDDYFDKINRGRNSTFYTCTQLFIADNFYAENLTIENSAGPFGQAIALYVRGDRC